MLILVCPSPFLMCNFPGDCVIVTMTMTSWFQKGDSKQTPISFLSISTPNSILLISCFIINIVVSKEGEADPEPFNLFSFL